MKDRNFVVCVNAKPLPNKGFGLSKANGLKEGEIYSHDGSIHIGASGYPCFWINELKDEKRTERFRPVQNIDAEIEFIEQTTLKIAELESVEEEQTA